MKEDALRVIIEDMPKDYLSVGISVVSMLIAMLSLCIAYRTLTIQKKHNLKIVKPIIDILIGDYEGNIYVMLKNQGLGIATISDLVCEYKGDVSLKEERYSSLIKLLGDENAPSSIIESYDTFVEDINNRSLPPNGEIYLVKLTSNKKADNTAIRLMLKDVCISVHYLDVYGESYSTRRELEFFGRNFC